MARPRRAVDSTERLGGQLSAQYLASAWPGAPPPGRHRPAAAPLPLSTASVASIACFLLIHDLAARWTYSDLPYDLWSRSLFGASIDQTLGFTRNQFDRLVHFLFGLLAIRPVTEIAYRHFGLGPRAALYVAPEFVLACSAVYEIFEWQLALFMDPADADAYNGQQGDIFDSQKDMALAAIGALITTILLALQRKRPIRGI